MIIVGLGIGVIAGLLVLEHNPIGITLTLLIGLVGAILGGYLGNALDA